MELRKERATTLSACEPEMSRKSDMSSITWHDILAKAPTSQTDSDGVATYLDSAWQAASRDPQAVGIASALQAALETARAGFQASAVRAAQQLLESHMLLESHRSLPSLGKKWTSVEGCMARSLSCVQEAITPLLCVKMCCRPLSDPPPHRWGQAFHVLCF